MSDTKPEVKYLKDYQPPAFEAKSVSLTFDLFDDQAIVESNVQYQRVNQSGTLVLNGKDLELLTIRLNDVDLSNDKYRIEGEELILLDPPEAFQMDIKTRIEPHNNTSLEGLYRSSKMFCTQCEAEGFRKITYFQDRPDVMSSYTTTIIADQERYPVLLSNGNLVNKGTLENSRHWATWKDPHRKPSYLFALVAGDLVSLDDQFTTKSGRNVTLRIFVEKENIDKCDHAMNSLKQCMKWDEDVFGREYDLDIFMIVAVADFNMGAMENKGLNVFNSSYVLAKPETATDMDYEKIQGVIAHEYFHNWTGNRITCRDWFQLSLKEGLTVFRDQQFTADHTSNTIKRIKDVNVLRIAQFTEDSGPMAHSVRPDSYIEINNFYTATIYYKGAELIRMMYTLLGKTHFFKAMDTYFDRHDGQAVTTEDFVKCMEDASGQDLTQFRRWYSQAGTPVVTAESKYIEAEGILELKLSQNCPPTPGQPDKKPFHIPVRMGLLDSVGKELDPGLENSECLQFEKTIVLNLTETEQTFRFAGIKTKPTLSLFRKFSAPVIVEYPQSDEELIFLIAHDTDDFNRWQASQRILTQKILELVGQSKKNKWSPDQLQTEAKKALSQLAKAYQSVLKSEGQDLAFVYHLLSLPGESYLGDQMAVVDAEGVHHARNAVRKALAELMRITLLDTYEQNKTNNKYRYNATDAGKRAIKNLCLDYLASIENPEMLGLCEKQFRTATNMTDEIAAFSCLVRSDHEDRSGIIDDFYKKWHHDPLVMDMWLSIQAQSSQSTITQIETLLSSPAFDAQNPNKLRSVIGGFCAGNLINFHKPDGSGYRFLSKWIETLNQQNPQIAARLLSPLIRWKRYDQSHQDLMKAELERLSTLPDLSNDVFEIVSKSLV